MSYNPVSAASSRRNFHKFPIILLVLIATMPSGTFAGSLFFTELSEAELSAIRGMYVSRSRVQYFGLSMTTQWATPARRAHNVGMSIAVQVNGDTPNLRITRTGSLGEEVDNSLVNEAEVNPALEQISGAVQSIQVSGIDNAVHNKVAINVIDSNNTVTSSEAQDLPLGRHTYQTGSGITTDFSISNESLGYKVVTGQGVVTQALSYNALSNTNQLLQSANIIGNGQSIVNAVRLDVAFDNTWQLRTNNTNFGIRNLMGR
ncbi:MAG: hypothetical protein KBT88_03870 [Gammaproteobacteria bacterium]|nr:hypothetical protein [Gammaproteobacteria bacterium]MBQ0838900.1 hypothetical protein [Gammaproteobacteria bacterium]